ncbi:MAG: alpha-D-ribose 1-methylphosphonate 5-triphosphate diphosphatase [Rhodobacteraceae bacterium]|nr:alpha-D-ribose 1-methylphosphonate 5-triphosphate diphosphatase [Paracoccaceae bacterium]
MSDRTVPGGETILANARLVLPQEVVRGAVRVADGIITALDTGAAVPPGAVDCEGDYLCPGLIELHTDNLERHMSPRPGVDWPHIAAILAHDAELAGCGISTVYDAIRVGSLRRPGRTRYGKYARQMATEILDLRGRGVLRISHYLHLRAEVCSETLVEELAEFGPADRVGILSLMDHTPGQRQFADTRQYETYLRGKYNLGADEIAAHFEDMIALTDRLGTVHREGAVRRAAELGAILASHDDTTPEHVAESAEAGARLAEFPTTRLAAEACRRHGIAVMMGAPNLLRGGSHSGNVAAAELEDAGLLDILSSDYVPASLLMGAVSLGEETGDMARCIAHVTEAPARAAGLGDRGVLAVGLRADLLRFALLDRVPVTRGLWVRGQRVA